MENTGAGNHNVALMATAGATEALVADVTARAQGSGGGNYAAFLTGSGTGVRLKDVTALAENGINGNRALWNYDGSRATLHGGSFIARGGTQTFGIHNSESGTYLDATSVIVLAELGGSSQYGLYNGGGAEATLRGGSFTARGGSFACGIYNRQVGATLEATSVTALGEDASGDNRGLYNHGTARATLHGGSFTGRGGNAAYGIHNYYSGGRLEATSITALGEEGSVTNYGFHNTSAAEATLRGGSLTGRGGSTAAGISNSASGTTLRAPGVTAAGELASGTGSKNYGLHNHTSAKATVHGGSFTASGGSSSLNYGSMNESTATLQGGAFVARNGLDATGIYNTDALTARSVTALGESATNNYGLQHASTSTADVTQSVLEGTTYSILQSAGAITVSNSRLVGAAPFGTITCVGVSRDVWFASNGCP